MYCVTPAYLSICDEGERDRYIYIRDSLSSLRACEREREADGVWYESCLGPHVLVVFRDIFWFSFCVGGA